MITEIANLPAIVEGSGKPLVMLHGYLSSKESFTHQIKYFSRYFKVIAPDMTGFGGTVMPWPYDLGDYSREITALIEALGAEKVDVMAHSFGARVLLKMLPDLRQIDKIVLVGAAGLKPRFRLRVAIKKAVYKTIKPFLSPEQRSKFGSSDYRNLSDVMKKSFNMIIKETFDKKLSSIDNPALIICGENDRETPPYMARRFHRGLKNSTLEIIGGAGHFAFIDKPAEFDILVKEFLLS